MSSIGIDFVLKIGQVEPEGFEIYLSTTTGFLTRSFGTRSAGVVRLFG